MQRQVNLPQEERLTFDVKMLSSETKSFCDATCRRVFDTTSLQVVGCISDRELDTWRSSTFSPSAY